MEWNLWNWKSKKYARKRETIVPASATIQPSSGGIIIISLLHGIPWAGEHCRVDPIFERNFIISLMLWKGVEILVSWHHFQAWFESTSLPIEGLGWVGVTFCSCFVCPAELRPCIQPRWHNATDTGSDVHPIFKVDDLHVFMPLSHETWSTRNYLSLLRLSLPSSNFVLKMILLFEVYLI